MSETRMRPNRRCEPRYYFETGSPVAWQRSAHRTRRRKGWLHDTSKSGISFFVETPRQPHIGEDVLLNRAFNTDSKCYRVVRTVPLEGNLSLVGCRRVLAGTA